MLSKYHRPSEELHMAEYDCNPVGGGQPPGLYQKTLSQRKKKRSKTNCFKTFKTSRHFLCKGMDSEMGRHSAQEATFLPCTPQHLPYPTQTNPIPSAQALRGKQRSPSVELSYRKRTMEKGPQRPRRETEDSLAVLPCSQSGLGLINLFLG